MSAEACALTCSWKVGGRTCTFTVPKVKTGQTVTALMEWEPNVPERLTPDEIAEYRRGRDQAIAALGLKVLILEL